MTETKTLDMLNIMHRQPIVNIGMTGHVANGKSSLTKNFSGKATQQFADERVRNITIQLGYANTKIWRCNSCSIDKTKIQKSPQQFLPDGFSSSDSSLMSKRCQKCKELLELVNHISIVDCPGHNELTSTMLNGSSVMDYAILVEACNNEKIPAPQTAEHLIATTAAKIPTCAIVMNKIDLIKKDKSFKKIEEISNYVKTLMEKQNIKNIPPVIPVSATFGANIDVLCQQLSMLKIPKSRDPFAQFKMIVIRSFDVNKPGTNVTKLNGGVIGGTIMRGMLKVGDKVNIYPGMIKDIPQSEKKFQGADFMYAPITGEVLSIKSDKNELDFAIPGGLLGIQLTIDPAFTKRDHLSGGLVLKKSDVDNQKLSKSSQDDSKSSVIPIVRVYDKIIVKMEEFLMDETSATKMLSNKLSKDAKVNVKMDVKMDVKVPELMINFNSNNINCRVKSYKKSGRELFLFLDRPIAVDSVENVVTIMKRNTGGSDMIKNDCGKIIGKGVIVDGNECILMDDQ
jgi:translation initiation factor 2 subunit 3